MKYEVVNNVTEYLDEIEKIGIKALLFDSTMKEMNEASRIKSFRLMRFQIRNKDVQDGEQEYYDIHLHLVPYKQIGKTCIEPIVKNGVKTVSYAEARLDEIQLNNLVYQWLSTMSTFDNGRIYNIINNTKIQHHGNQPPGAKNSYVYEINEQGETFIRTQFTNFVKACENPNPQSTNIFGISHMMKLRRKIIMENLNL